MTKEHSETVSKVAGILAVGGISLLHAMAESRLDKAQTEASSLLSCSRGRTTDAQSSTFAPSPMEIGAEIAAASQVGEARVGRTLLHAAANIAGTLLGR